MYLNILIDHLNISIFPDEAVQIFSMLNRITPLHPSGLFKQQFWGYKKNWIEDT